MRRSESRSPRPSPCQATRPMTMASSARDAVAEGASAHDDRGEDRDGADRQVDARGQHHDGLGAAQDADDGDLLQDGRQRAGLEEVVGQQAEDRRARPAARSSAPPTGVWCSQCCSFFSATVGPRGTRPPFPRRPCSPASIAAGADFASSAMDSPPLMARPSCGPVMPRAARWPPLHVSLASMAARSTLSAGLSPSRARCPWWCRSTRRRRPACR